MTLDQSWFSEIHPKEGSAFSLKRGQTLLDQKTPFQHLEVFESEAFGRVMTLDGCLMVADLENFIYHEMMIHPALCSHENPETVVVIGGGDCGSLKEVLRHDSVKRAVQIEIDEAVTRAAEVYFPALCEANNDPRAELKFIDGVAWMAEQPDASVDVIIVDSTDPVGPAAALFGEAFLKNVLRVLKPGGILTQQSESPLYHPEILADLRQYLFGLDFKDVRTLTFPQPVYPSGWWSATSARKGCDFGAVRPAPAGLQYYSAEIHQAASVLPPFVRQRLQLA